MALSTFGLTPQDVENLQATARALGAAVAAVCDELIAVAEAARAAYMAARQEAEPTIDTIMALLDKMEDAGEPRRRDRGVPCPRPSRRLWPRESAVRPTYKVKSVRAIRPTARSTIKQQRNRRKP